MFPNAQSAAQESLENLMKIAFGYIQEMVKRGHHSYLLNVGWKYGQQYLKRHLEASGYIVKLNNSLLTITLPDPKPGGEW